MKIIDSQITTIEIPFLHNVAHASATRGHTESILVTFTSENGLKGYGEGCPRSYVTNETIDSTFAFFHKHHNSITQIHTLADINEWVYSNRKTIDMNPAAWCAIELALLDLLGKESNQSVETLLALPPLAQKFQYSAVLGTNNLEHYRKLLHQYAALGLRDYKVKLCGNFSIDRYKIDIMKQMSSIDSIRLDANNLWRHEDEAIDYIQSLEYPFNAIEEPLESRHYQGCKHISRACNIACILDESFLTINDFEHLANHPNNWIINLRISKMGGIIRSLSIAQKAEAYKIPLIIGAHVGETSILTRAALTVSNSLPHHMIIAQEGAFGTHLLQHDITNRPLQFGKHGLLTKHTNIFNIHSGLGIL